VDLGGVERTFSVSNGAAAVDLDVSARVTGAGALRKSGLGTLRLSQANEYAGGTTVSGGVLEVTSPAALGGGPAAFAGGTLQLRLDGTPMPNPLSAGPAVSTNISVVGSAAGATARLGGAATLGSALNVVGTDAAGAAAPTTLIVQGPVTLGANTSINVTGPATLQLSGAVGGAAAGFAPVVAGTGTVRLGGTPANTYTGLTRVTGGTLELAKPAGVDAVPGDLAAGVAGVVRLLAPDQIADTATVTISAGGLVDPNGHSETVATLSLDGGTLAANGGGLTATAGTTVSGGGELRVRNVRQNALSISSGGRVVVEPGGGAAGTSRLSSLTVSGSSARLDLNDHDLVFDYSAGGPSPLGSPGTAGSVLGMMAAAYAGNDWTGGGLASGAAGATDGLRSLGAAEASDVLSFGGGPTAEFSGQTVDASTVLVRYTFAGDANVDGRVDVADLGRLATGFNKPGVWSAGDFDFSGSVNVTDLGILATNFNRGTGAAFHAGEFAALLAAYGLPSAAVPEPAGLAPLALAAAAGLAARRRRRVS
jgi:autotransporter-associated beta strand protein